MTVATQTLVFHVNDDDAAAIREALTYWQKNQLTGNEVLSWDNMEAHGVILAAICRNRKSKDSQGRKCKCRRGSIRNRIRRTSCERWRRRMRLAVGNRHSPERTPILPLRCSRWPASGTPRPKWPEKRVV